MMTGSIFLNLLLMVVHSRNFAAATRDPARLESLHHIALALFVSVATPLVMRMFVALAVFPFRSKTFLHEQLAQVWNAEARVRRALQHFSAGTARDELRLAVDGSGAAAPPSRWLWFSRAEVDELLASREALIAATRRVTTLLFWSMAETRWGFSAFTTRLARFYELSMAACRLNRACLDSFACEADRQLATQRDDPRRAEVLWHIALERDRHLEAFKDGDARCAEFDAAARSMGESLGEFSALLVSQCAPLSQLAELETNAEDASSRARRGSLVAELETAQAATERVVARLTAAAREVFRMQLRAEVAQVRADSARLQVTFGADSFARSRLMTSVCVAERVVAAHRELLEFLRAGPAETWPAPGWASEWRATFLARANMLDGHREPDPLRDYEPLAGARERYRVLVDSVDAVLTSPAFVQALKFTLGIVLLSLMAYMRAMAQWFTHFSVSQAFFVYVLVAFKWQSGLVLEQAFLRLGGVVLGFLYGAVMFYLACVGGYWALGGWALFLLTLPAVAAFLLVKEGPLGFGGFMFLKMLYTLIAVKPTAADYFSLAGVILACCFVGGALAVLLSVATFAETGDRVLRRQLAEAFGSYALLLERILELRAQPPDAEASDADAGAEAQPTTTTRTTSATSSSSFSLRHVPISVTLVRAEVALSKLVHVTTQEPLHAIEIERKVRLHSRVPCGEHSQVVRAAQSVWRCLWTLHHLLGICFRVEGRARKSSHRLSSRLRFSIDQMLGHAFALVADELGDRRYRGGLTLRPLAADPKLLREAIYDHLVACLADDDFVKAVLASEDMLVLAYLPLHFDMLLDCAHALSTVFEYVQSVQRPLKVARRLRAAAQGDPAGTLRAAPLLTRQQRVRGFTARTSAFLRGHGHGEDLPGGFDTSSWMMPDTASAAAMLSWGTTRTREPSTRTTAASQTSRDEATA